MQAHHHLASRRIQVGRASLVSQRASTRRLLYRLVIALSLVLLTLGYLNSPSGEEIPQDAPLQVISAARVQTTLPHPDFSARIPVPAVAMVSCRKAEKRLMGKAAITFTMITPFQAEVNGVEHLDDFMQKNRNWNVWIPCGTALDDRMYPAWEHAAPGSIVLNVPGKCVFAAKVVLWQGLVEAFGEDRAARFAPMTFVRPSRNVTFIRQYALQHPEANFIFKSGQHRQKGSHTIAASDPNLWVAIETYQPVVIQVSYDTVRLSNLRTAFRTYVWITCKSSTVAAAVVDWRSPGYIAATDTDFFASGYTKSQSPSKSSYDLLRELFPNENEFQQMTRAVTARVAGFLHAFERKMCSIEPDQSEQMFARSLVIELFGFDWIPIRNDKGLPDALLLEANRFPDMMLHTAPFLQDSKDWMKVCTVMRRFSREPIHAEYSRCYQDVQESNVLQSSANWEALL